MTAREDSARQEALSLTVLIAARNEELNIGRCIQALGRAERVIVIDSFSTDRTREIAERAGAEVKCFRYMGGYPKKREWALTHLDINTGWVLLLDADEVVPETLWREIDAAITRHAGPNAYVIKKGFHFLGRRMRFGGFSHSAVLLFRLGTAHFERIETDYAAEYDMEIHERVIVDGPVSRLRTPLIHEDFKDLEAYIDRHNQYSTWEAHVRRLRLSSGSYGAFALPASFRGNVQQRRRFLKNIAIRLPFEPLWWFLYHFVIRLGFLEGKRGLIAAQVRASYIAQVRAKIFELSLGPRGGRINTNSP